MRSRISKSTEQMLLIFMMIFHAVVRFLLMDIRLIYPAIKTFPQYEVKDGVSEKRVGPPLLRRHIVEINPVSAELGHKRLEFLMELDEPQSRNPLSIINGVSGSNFFISMSNKNGTHLRNILSRCLVPRVYYEALTASMQDLMSQLKNLNNPKFDRFDQINQTIEQHIFRFFVKTIFGIDLADDMYKVLVDLENALKSTWPQIRLFLSDETMDKLPFIKARNENIHKLITLFLSQQIRLICHNNIALSDRNFLHILLKEKLGQLNKTIQQLDADDIKKLAEDRDIRVCISGLIATRPLQKAVKEVFRIIYTYTALDDSRTLESIVLNRDLLLKELREKPLNSTTADLNDRQKRPYLEALCLEALRFSVPTESIVRYTKSAIVNEELQLDIPAESIIIFNLVNLVKMGGAFDIRRYFKPDGSFDEKMGLNHGSLTPFGIGSRKCPGALIAMVIMKTYSVAFIEQIKDYNVINGLVFEGDDRVQTTSPKPTLATPVTLFNTGAKQPTEQMVAKSQDDVSLKP